MQESSGQGSSAARLWTALNQSPRLTFSFVVIPSLAVVCAQAATRLLWGDELITLAVARTGSSGAIWQALLRGADPNPPLTHLAVLATTRLLGESALAVRVPSLAAMLLASICIWAILRRWVAPGFAAVGVLAWMATRGFDYSYEARSYAPLAAFTMAALFCWLRASDQVRRSAGTVEHAAWPPRSTARSGWLAGMAVCLALALSSNYYGVLAWFPIAVGELVLSVRTRRVYPATWLCMAAAALAFFAYLPLIRHNLAEFGPHAWNRPGLSMLPESYLVLVEGVLWPVVLGAALLWWQQRKNGPMETARAPGIEPHERAALFVLLGYPLLGLALALGKGAMISPRCVIPVCCGFGIAAGLLSARLVREARCGAALLVAASIWVLARQSACAVLLHRQRTSFFRLMAHLEDAPAGPIYLSDSSLALPLAHYASPELRARLVFPIDFAAIHAWEPEDSGEQNLWAGRNGLFPLRIVPYSPDLAAGRPSIVIARPGGWLARKLAFDGLALSNITSPEDSTLLGGVGGVFTPMDHEDTRLLAPVR